MLINKTKISLVDNDNWFRGVQTADHVYAECTVLFSILQTIMANPKTEIYMISLNQNTLKSMEGEGTGGSHPIAHVVRWLGEGAGGA